MAEIQYEAVMDEDRLYRYSLRRRWGTGPAMAFIMLNPSTADAERDDPTIRRCMGYARREGWAGIEVVNLFALRVTRPVHLFDGTIAPNPNGPLNVGYVRNMLVRAGNSGWPVVVAWGKLTAQRLAYSEAWMESISHYPLPLLCLGTNQDGSPAHPLYRLKSQPFEKWERP